MTDEDAKSLSELLGRKKSWLVDALRYELLAVDHAREIFTTINKYLEVEYPDDTVEMREDIDPEDLLRLLCGVGDIAYICAGAYENTLPPWTAPFALFEKDADILARSLVAYLETEWKIPRGSVSERSVKAYFNDAERRKAAAWLFSSQLSKARRPPMKLRTSLCDDPVTEILDQADKSIFEYSNHTELDNWRARRIETPSK